MNTRIGGHELTRTEVLVLNYVVDYMRDRSGDSQWSPDASPKGDGRAVPVLEIFPLHADKAKRQAIARLATFGVLKACEIEYCGSLVFCNSTLKGMPLRSIG